MKDTIFIVGKSDPHLESADAIRKQGYKVGLLLDASQALKQPHAFDVVLPLEFNNITGELQKLDAVKESIAGLLCTYENYVTAKAMLTNYLKLPGSSIDSARMATDKYLMRQAFMKADPRITPRFQQVTTQEELLAFAATTTYPFILKPTNLVKSLLVLRCNNETELLNNFAYAQKTIHHLYEKYSIYDRSPQLIVEEFIQGKSCSIAAFVDDTGTPHFCNSIVSITTAAEHGADDNYLYGRILPAAVAETLSKRLFEVAETGVRALKMRSSPAHIELMYNEDEVKIVEIGARIGGYRPRMYRHSYDIDLIAQEVTLALGEVPHLEGDFKAYSAVFELFPEATGKFKALRGIKDERAYTYLSIKPKPGQLIGPAKHGYKAAAIITIVHKDKATFEDLCRSVDAVEVEVE